jgi:hypothetical protein
MATQEKMTLQEKLAASKQEVPKVQEQKQDQKEDGYKSLRLKQFATKNGTMIKPNADGIFIPKSQEEYDMLEYYANQAIAYVERV